MPIAARATAALVPALLPSLVALAGPVLAAPGAARAAEPTCRSYTAERQALFGELHVHTAASMDAYMFGTRLRPDDAYRFARGEAVTLPPLGAGGGARAVALERPLDFAAVTDHASGFGATRLCSTPGTAGYDSPDCRAFRAPLATANTASIRSVVAQLRERMGDGLGTPAFCGPGGALCRSAASDVWREMQEAAKRWDDPTDACAFTTFVAYEYTATPEATKIHRNVIFRGDTVPALPISYSDEPDVIAMWRKLRAQCNDAGTGCDALAIPHNPNLSNGHMFTVDYGDAASVAEEREVAALRASMEPVVEIMQMKGDSECRNGMWNVVGGADELCGFHKIRPEETPDCEDGTGKGALAGEGCVSRLDYARYALVEGLREEARIGVNPYAFGVIAATDGHDATPGAVEEWRQDLAIGRATTAPGYNLGGLAGVWAEENSREAIFDALRRRETFGTSGPRMRVRFFGGWDVPVERCDDAAMVAKSYADAVPMGGRLAASTDAQRARGPAFVVAGMRDPGAAAHPGTKLERLQLIKGWADDEGRIHQRVFDVAGGVDARAGVDAATCTPSGHGADALCAVWRDPEFDAARRAVYYARV
ncbi:MAG: DUF3604 domain-containing protein, partial [Myxococcales bacterium]|nr:DUF3604 domain-containing protein [Myxococcales bacterium]